ncbi:MAG: CCA tRNA nucleotidyltransferase, partial [Methanothrix sp.]
FLAVHPHPLSGPYIWEGRVVVEESRKHNCARDLLAAELEVLSLGKHLSEAIRRGHNIYAGQEILEIRDREFRIFLGQYLDARAPIY